MTKRNEKEIIAAFTHMATNELGGKMEMIDGYKSDGSQYKKIVIEYDLKEWKRNEI